MDSLGWALSLLTSFCLRLLAKNMAPFIVVSHLVWGQLNSIFLSQVFLLSSSIHPKMSEQNPKNLVKFWIVTSKLPRWQLSTTAKLHRRQQSNQQLLKQTPNSLRSTCSQSQQPVAINRAARGVWSEATNRKLSSSRTRAMHGGNHFDPTEPKWVACQWGWTKASMRLHERFDAMLRWVCQSVSERSTIFHRNDVHKQSRWFE